MKSYDELTDGGQLRHLRLLARAAMTAYEVAPDDLRIEVAAQSFNTIFRVTDYAGRVAALRVGPAERIHADGTESVEARWIRMLRHDGAVSPPDVIDARDGTPVVSQAYPGVPGERICMLFCWVFGKPLSESMTPARARDMGRLAALLHRYAGDIASQAVPSVLIADRVLYWRVENRLGELPGSLMTDALDRANRVIAEIWADPPHPPHLIHGDLTPDNVMVNEDALVPIDFQDLVWGFEIQDLAITLSSLARYDDAEELQRQFRLGYRAVRPWPEFERETLASLIAARRLQQLNLALTLRRTGLDQKIARAQQLIADWMI